ncbi:MAG: ABC transporter ATP-binding protein [Deinococcales bacterium]
MQALSEASLEVRAGEFVALIGANGAGKTTTLRAISGLAPLASGSIRMRGADLGTRPPSQRVRDGLAHCPEGREIFPRMTVHENLELGAIRGRPAAERYGEVFRLFPVLSQRSGQLAGSLSGGEQQMLAIGRALMSEPELLLLDEPSLGLAPVLVREVGEVLARLNDVGTSVLLVEQNAALALALADRGYVLENGRVVLEGAAAQLREDPTVQRAYLGT